MHLPIDQLNKLCVVVFRFECQNHLYATYVHAFKGFKFVCMIMKSLCIIDG